MGNDKIKQLVAELLDVYNESGDFLRDFGETVFKMRCPFHEEKTGSFVIEFGMDIAHCFGCGYSSDIQTLFKNLKEVQPTVAK